MNKRADLLKKLFLFGLPALIRIWFGMLVGVYFSADDFYDDALLMYYATFPDKILNFDIRNVMLKEMGMPLFYRIVNLTCLPESMVISLLWVIAAGLTFLIVHRLAKNRIAAFIVYLFTLFTPAAFEIWCGTRMYRAQLLNPMYLIVIQIAVLMVLVVWDDRFKLYKSILSALLFGLVLSFTYYIKEDGIWLLGTVLFILILGLISVIVKGNIKESKKRITGCLLSLAIPLLVLVTITNVYKYSNYKMFGVFETNVRTGGESGKFVENIYRIESSERTNRSWANYEALEKAYQASKTLQDNPEFMESVYTSGWAQGDVRTNAIQGDFLGWIIKDAIYDSKVVTDQAEKEAFFKKVNAELDATFKDGTLKKDRDRIQVVSSVGGKTPEELRGVARRAFAVYKYHILLKDYEPGSCIVSSANNSLVEEASAITNMDLSMPDSEGMYWKNKEIEVSNRIIRVIFYVYRVLNMITLILALVGAVCGLIRFIRCIIKRIKPDSNDFMALLSLGLFGISYVYGFMVMLFCTEFGNRNIHAEKMYSIGVVSLLIVAEAVGISVLYNLILSKLSVQFPLRDTCRRL